MSTAPRDAKPLSKDFLNGLQYLGANLPDSHWLDKPAIAAHARAIAQVDDAAVYQTLLAADALRYLTLQLCGSKASGHPGGFASSAEAYAALVMLGHTNILTEVGHHAPGFYSAMFLDGSLQDMGIHDVADLMQRFREREGLLGHLSGAIPGLLAPAGPLGQGQHFAMAAALLHPGVLFPFTLGDGGIGEPYVMSSMLHFNTAYPTATNFLPVLVWNGFSQEHHAMVSLKTNAEMTAYWSAHGFRRVVLVNAKDFDDTQQSGAYVDSTLFGWSRRLAFTQAVLRGMAEAAQAALSGELSVFIIKQLKGAGVHAHGAKSHNLYPGDTLDREHIGVALQKRALPEAAWDIVRTNFQRAGGGSAARTAVTESVLPLPPLGALRKEAFSVGGNAVPSTALGALVVQVGRWDPRFVVTNADGNEASGLKHINEALRIRHPTVDALYHQAPDGQVYEPLNEDACAGLAGGLALFGARALWLSYESFAVNGLPILQTVAQAMAELRRPTPSLVSFFTAGALEQGRNGWTHQRPEVENYFAAMLRAGNVYTLFPCDANMIQVAYEWATHSQNKAIAIFASKSALPVYTTLEHAGEAIEQGATTLYATAAATGRRVVFAVTGDMVLLPVFAAKDRLEAQGFHVRIVCVANPRRLYRPCDVAWDRVALPDGKFMPDSTFHQLFDADVLLAVTGGASAVLEPVLLRSRAAQRDVFCWKRGETTASPAELMQYNGLTADVMTQCVLALTP